MSTKANSSWARLPEGVGAGEALAVDADELWETVDAEPEALDDLGEGCGELEEVLAGACSLCVVGLGEGLGDGLGFDLGLGAGVGVGLGLGAAGAGAPEPKSH